MSNPTMAIYNFTDEQLINEMKNRFEFNIIAKKNKKYDFCDDVWNEIKEYAGIYHISINWNVDKISIKHIHQMFRGQTNTYFKKYTKVSKGHMLKRLLQIKKSKELMIELNVFINPVKPKKEPKEQNPLLDTVSVGDEVIYEGFLGLVAKINKTSITFKKYKMEEGQDEDETAFTRQTFTYSRSQYIKTETEKGVAIRLFRLPYPTELDYHRRSVDYGY
jgi:preprotein translocase subunit YajC|tara:strand:+ start:1700 stop:2356 length:657 start_codon:yes stop_codon:yes gene_type:complete